MKVGLKNLDFISKLDDDIFMYGLSESEMAKGLGLDIISIDEGRSCERELVSSESETGASSEETNAFWTLM